MIPVYASEFLISDKRDLYDHYCFDAIYRQGLSEQAVNAFRVMRADGLKPSNLALNSLINAFGEDRRDTEAFSVLQYMKENASCSTTSIIPSPSL